MKHLILMLLMAGGVQFAQEAEPLSARLEIQHNEDGESLVRLRWENDTRRPVCVSHALVNGGAIYGWVKVFDTYTEEELPYTGPVRRASDWPPGNEILIPPGGLLTAWANISENFALQTGGIRVQARLPGIYCDTTVYPLSQRDVREGRYSSERIVLIAEAE